MCCFSLCQALLDDVSNEENSVVSAFAFGEAVLTFEEWDACPKFDK